MVCGTINTGSYPVPYPRRFKMKNNTEENREKLAMEAVDQMDIKTMCGIIREQLETYYDTLSSEDFNNEWEQVFGED